MILRYLYIIPVLRKEIFHLNVFFFSILQFLTLTLNSNLNFIFTLKSILNLNRLYGHSVLYVFYIPEFDVCRVLCVAGGNFSTRDVGNLSMLPLADNWAASMSGMGTQGLLTPGGAGGGVGGMGQGMGAAGQYGGMWMPSAVGNLGQVSQSCGGMPSYLRPSPTAYSLPVSTPSTSPTPSVGLPGALQTSVSGHGLGGQVTCDNPYELGSYAAVRDPRSGGWSNMTPPL
jgi:hypothetical protein